MARVWALPSADTFSVPPIQAFVERWLAQAVCGLGRQHIVVDPFARNARYGTHTNDLDPQTGAQYHMDALVYLDWLIGSGCQADAVIFDPPYSPRQIAEVYRSVGRDVTGEDTQNARLYRLVRARLHALLRPGGIALSFGWNSSGFGRKFGYELLEVLLVAHGGAHNDTICLAERKPVVPPVDDKEQGAASQNRERA